MTDRAPSYTTSDSRLTTPNAVTNRHGVHLTVSAVLFTHAVLPTGKLARARISAAPR